jgi:drug/metabolite transporter (DMT)-like permease
MLLCHLKCMSDNKVDRTAWLLLIGLSLIWGCSFILIKKALIAFSPYQLGALRLGISSLAFTPVILIYRKEIPWNRLGTFFMVGLTGSGIPAFLFFIAQTKVNSSIAGVLNSMTPIWTLILGGLLFKTGFSKLKLAGVLLGFVGAVSLLWKGNGQDMGNQPLYGILILLATLCYGTSVNMVQYFFSGVRPLIISAVSFFTVGIPAIIYLLTTDVFSIVQNHPDAMYSLASVTALSLFGTVIASVVFYHLVQKTNAVFGSTTTYFMPIVALAWGFLDKEYIGIQHLFSMMLILSGVYLIKKG